MHCGIPNTYILCYMNVKYISLYILESVWHVEYISHFGMENIKFTQSMIIIIWKFHVKTHCQQPIATLLNETFQPCQLFLFLIIQNYTFKYYYMVHTHTQYRGTMLQQGFWCWYLLINTPSRKLYGIILIRIKKTWWCPLSAETCSSFDLRI